MITLSILPNYLFLSIWCLFLKQIIAFPGILKRPSWRLTAILELSEHSNSICIINFTFYMHKYISYVKNSIFLTVRCHFTAQWHYMIDDGGHLGYWQPYWNNLNIWTVFITLVEHFLCLKHKIYYHHYLSQPFAALLKQKIWFQDSPWRRHIGKWRPYWKFAWPAFFFFKGDLYRVFVPNLLLI